MYVSEIFYSIQGEGLRMGHPSVFVRFFGCNFRCPGFGCKRGELSKEPDEIANYVCQNKEKFPTYDSLPLAKTGCDSYPSWHPKLKCYSKDMDVHMLYNEILKVVPDDVNTNDIDIVFTGGEPLLPGTQKFLEQFFNEYEDFLKSFSCVTFETNGTQDIRIDLSRFNVVLSVSPKLSVSGVPRDKAIRPDVITSYSKKHKMYLKFVVSDPCDVDEVCDIINTLDFKPDVYIMPEGGTEERYNENMKKVANIAMSKGFIFCPRLHVTLFGNSWNS